MNEKHESDGVDLQRRNSIKKGVVTAAAVGVGLMGLSSLAKADLLIKDNLRPNNVIITPGLLPAPKPGAIEFQSDKFYGTITTSEARKELALADTALTQGRVPFNTTNGRLTDVPGFTFDNATSTLTVAGGSAQSNIGKGLMVNSIKGNAAADSFNVKGASDDYLIYTDAANNRVGIGTNTPKSKLHIIGLPAYANNAAAIAGGLTAGALYRTGADPDVVCVVH